MRAFWNSGATVLGYDIDENKLQQLRLGQNYLKHLGDDLVAPMVGSGRFEVSSIPDRLESAEAIVIMCSDAAG